MNGHVDQFRDALASRGLDPADIVPDGEWHRCRTVEHPRKKNGAYRLHLDGRPAGVFINHADGLPASTWKSDGKFSFDAEAKKRIETEKRRREREQLRKAQMATLRAGIMWRAASPAFKHFHQYLRDKGISAHGTRILGDDLLVPMREAGKLVSLQRIKPDGSKKYLPGRSTKGLYFAIGRPRKGVLIAEGFATAATIHELSGCAVAVAFDCGNLLNVARALRGRYPNLLLMIAGDDDWRTQGNPGRTHAENAAKIIGCRAIFPRFPTDRGDTDTDWNDLYALCGRDEAAAQLRRGIANAAD